MPMPPLYAGTSITKAPDHFGRGGRAWRVDNTKATLTAATVCLWIVHCPNVHPAWDHWVFCCTHLRPTEGLKSAELKYPDATHELMIIALNPEMALPDPDKFEKMHYLSPLDCVEQFKVDNDAQADTVMETLVQLSTEGIIAPDSDYRSAWMKALWQTAHKVKSGVNQVRLQ